MVVASRRRYLSLVTLLLLLVGLGGCDALGMLQFYLANDLTRAEWNSPHDTITLPIEVATHVTIPVGVNGSAPMPFVLDTGSPGVGVIGNPRTRRLGLRPGRKLSVGGSGQGNTPTGNLLSGLTLSLGTIELHNQTAIYLPWDQISFYGSPEEVQIDGIIGYDILCR